MMVGNRMTSGIYRILNKINGKIYIGSATTIAHRWNRHRSDLNLNRHDNEHLQLSWNKYGENAFEFMIVQICEKEELLKWEQLWFETTNCCDNKIGYNKCTKAESRIGIKMSDKSRAKMSASRKGKPYTENEKARKGFQKGNTLSKGIARSEEHKQKLSYFHKGRPRPQEVKDKIKASHILRQIELRNAII